jgi:uncharacterized RDD family membrane protein YckC
MADTSTSTAPPSAAGLFRRLAALVYDALLLLAVLFLGTLVLLPLSGGQAITPQDAGPWEHVYRAWLVLLVAGFFGISWTRRGQTLGMMSWKIRLVRVDGSGFLWIHVLSRLGVGLALVVAAALGLWLLGDAKRPARMLLGAVLVLPALLNYALVYVDPLRRTLLDRWTGTRVVRIG